MRQYSSGLTGSHKLGSLDQWTHEFHISWLTRRWPFWQHYRQIMCTMWLIQRVIGHYAWLCMHTHITQLADDCLNTNRSRGICQAGQRWGRTHQRTMSTTCWRRPVTSYLGGRDHVYTDNIPSQAPAHGTLMASISATIYTVCIMEILIISPLSIMLLTHGAESL